jgi:hypothetical protein
MTTRVVALAGALVVGSATWFVTGISAQSKPAAARTYAPSKTAWGDPDLQGIYTDKDENGIPLEQVFEYACHEGNYAMHNILSAARAEEK